MAERGFEGMTLAAVAEDAAVSTATVHRRYASKDELAIAAMARVREQTQPAQTGDILFDLEALVRQIWLGLTKAVGMGLIGTILVEERQRPELINLFRKGVVEPRIAAIANVLREGQRQGVVRSDANFEVAAELLVGAVLARYLTGRRTGKRWFRSVAEGVFSSVRP